MMTPGQLVKCVALALDVPETIVAQHDRRLAEEGFRTTGGRGSSAPQIEAADAAKLVIAVLAGERFAQTFSTVRDLWNAHIRLVPWAAGRDGAARGIVIEKQISSLSKFNEARTKDGCKFGSALTALIEDCIDGQMDAFLRASSVSPRSRLEIKVNRPSAEARIGFRDSDEKYDAFLEFWFTGGSDSDVNREIRTTHYVSIVPLLRVAQEMRQ